MLLIYIWVDGKQDGEKIGNWGVDVVLDGYFFTSLYFTALYWYGVV